MKNKLSNITTIMAISLTIMLAISSAALGQDVGPKWTTFVGGVTDYTLYNGVYAPVGSFIDFYDPDGVHCGRDTVNEILGEGRYGMISILADDEDTPEDEGPELNDLLIVEVNGRPATPVGPDDLTWDETTHPAKEVNFLAEGSVSADFIVPSGKTASPGDILQYDILVENTGNGIDFYKLESVISSNGWTIQYSDALTYAEPGETIILRIILLVPPGAYSATDQIEFSAVSGIDATVRVDGNLITFVSPTDIKDNEDMLPTGFRLYQNYPNPFNPKTAVAYDLPISSAVSLDVYDLLGRKVKEFDIGTKPAGHHEFIIDAGSLASGVYLYRLSAGNYSDIKRMVLLK